MIAITESQYEVTQERVITSDNMTSPGSRPITALNGVGIGINQARTAP
jgi:hypothetical protein